MSSLARTTCNEMSDYSLGSQSPEDEHAHHAEPSEGEAEQESADNAAGHAPAEEHETDQQKKARLDAALRKYRATLRNEAETGNGGFSADYYRSQKPPHW